MRVTTADGRRTELELAGPKGGVKDPLSNDDIVAKARALAADLPVAETPDLARESSRA
ncbi:hypothetical protein [Amycolatopsis pithecellobii]|uniref:Uncharacterized protein n=1 Tax=Amycolatopsis pithecellobii TaxID=664692 RepID=A0A6N7Z3E8_9PSEU|nr:hypothetical protein [Amycolatopsis pithecellobii]MTD54554.1 hypothetical protein [Amycolatopsis pithecellobii]